MAEPPKDPRTPKYLPRLKYNPPEELAPEAEAEAEDDEDHSGEIALDGSEPTKPRPVKPKAKAQTPRPADLARPVDKSLPKSKPAGRLAGPPRAQPIDRSIPADPTRPGNESKPKAKAAPRDGDGEERQGTLIEQTPEGETFEARRRVRLIVGAVAVAAVVMAVTAIYRSFRSDDDAVAAEGAPDPGTVPAVAPAAPRKRSAAEQEALARGLLADARQLERAGKIDDALKKVDRVLAEFGEAPQSAVIAKGAKERHAQGLPLFVAGAAVVATKAAPKDPEPMPEPEAPADANPPAEVVAVPPPVVAPPPAEASPVPPAVRAEPRRNTGVGLTPAKVAARPLPPGFRAREDVGVHGSGWPLEITCDRDGSAMVLIPGDVFVQGRDDGKPEERPAHRVRLSSFYVDQHEVTSRQFGYFRDAPGDDRPMTSVSLAEARDYARWAGKSIPTEAQWEMSARATDGRLHPWGNARAEWDRPRAPKQIDPVMSFSADLSPYGVYDLSGNAWEWTNDWFETKYYASLKNQTAANPAGPATGKGRLPEAVVKGGSKDWDASWRSGMRPEAKLPYLGFRCVLNVEGSGAMAAPVQADPAAAQSVPAGGVPF